MSNISRKKIFLEKVKNTRPIVYFFFAIFLISLVGTLVLNCRTLANGTYSRTIKGTTYTYEINGDTFFYLEEREGATVFDVGVYHMIPAGTSISSGTHVTVDTIYFGETLGNVYDSTAIRNSAFSFSINVYEALYEVVSYEFTCWGAVVMQIVFAVGLLVGSPVSFIFVFQIIKELFKKQKSNQ